MKAANQRRRVPGAPYKDAKLTKQDLGATEKGKDQENTNAWHTTCSPNCSLSPYCKMLLCMYSYKDAAFASFSVYKKSEFKNELLSS